MRIQAHAVVDLLCPGARERRFREALVCGVVGAAMMGAPW